MEIDVNKLQSLPLEEFKKQFSDSYQSANNEGKEALLNQIKMAAGEQEKRIGSFITQTTVKLQLGEMIEIIPIAYIARNYFGKSKNWLYHRVNGYMINGKQMKFTENQLHTFNNALRDIGNKVGSIKLV